MAAEEEEMIKSEDDSTNPKVTEKEEPKKAKQVSNLDPLKHVSNGIFCSIP